MTRDQLIQRTRQLIAEGERLGAQPSLGSLQTWLQLSDDLLAAAWGTMDRYHLAWLMVGKPKDVVRGRPMTPDEEVAYVREVATQKTAALRASLDAVERQGMPFRGESGGVGPGQGMGSVPGEAITAGGPEGADEPGGSDERGEAGRPGEAGEPSPDEAAIATRHAHLARGSRRSIPLDPELQHRLDEARRAAGAHQEHDARRAPRPERLQR